MSGIERNLDGRSGHSPRVAGYDGVCGVEESEVVAEVGVESAVVEVDLIEVGHPLLDVRGRISVENLQIQSNFRSSNAFRYKSTFLN